MNKGKHNYSLYLSSPTYARYDEVDNPYPSGDHPSLNGHTYGYGFGEGRDLRLPPENRELRLYHWSSTRRGYGDGNRFPSPGNRQSGLMDHPWSSFQDHSARTSSPSQYISFEETPTRRPSSQTRIPTNPPPVSRIPQQVVVSNGSNSRLAFPHRLTPRLSFNQGRGMVNTYTPPNTDNESKLTKEEQEQVLRKLKKQIYNPAPTKVMPRRKVSLYYRDLNHNPSYFKDNKKLDEEGKRCAVCLEDFQAQDEVMLTPCNHMFHEECIVPWVKSHGKCPLCRSVFCERLEENATTNRNGPPPLPVAHSLFDQELLSLIQAVNEAFPWIA